MAIGTRFFWLLSCLLLAEGAWAQSFEFEKVRKEFPNDRVVYVRNSEWLQIQMVDTGLQISSVVRKSRMQLDSKTVLDLQDVVSYTPPFQKLQKIEAFAEIPVDGKYKTVKAKIGDEINDYDGDIFYEDIRKRKVEYPGMVNGSISNLYYETQISHLQFLGGFLFSNGLASSNSEFKLTFPKEVDMGWFLYGDTSKIQMSREERKGKVTLTWTLPHYDAFQDQDNAPSYRYFLPQIYVYIKEYTFKGRKIEVQKDLAHMHRVNYNFIKEVMEKPTDAPLRHKVDSVSLMLKQPIERAKWLYRWVQQNIRYIAFEDGLGGQIPRNADEVLRKGYGDCKDMSILLVKMLQRAGLNAFPAWIGTTDIPDDFRDKPHLAADNHMIAVLKLDTGFVFLDATASETQFGAPSSFIQGKRAVVAVNNDSFPILRVPIMSASFTHHEDSTWIQIKGDTLVGRGHVLEYGYIRERIARNLRRTDAKKQEEILESYCARGTDKCKVTQPTFSGLDNLDKPLELKFSFELPNYIRRIGEDIYLSLNLRKMYDGMKIDTAHRTLDRVFENLFSDHGYTRFDLPKGYEPQNLPNPLHIENDFWVVDESVRFENGALILDESYRLKQRKIPPSGFDVWNQDFKKLREYHKQNILLRKK